MTNPKNDMRKRFIEEIDETIFESLEFHSGLKKAVKKKTDPFKKSSTIEMRVKRSWKVPFIRLVGIAAAITFFITSINLFQHTTKKQTQPKPLHEEKINITQTEDPLSSILTEPSTEQSWTLNTEVEAKEAFGEDLLVPTYVSKNYHLEIINASGPSMENLINVVFIYASSEYSYVVTAERSPFENTIQGFEEVEINGTMGYLKKNEAPSNSDTELHWTNNNIHYTISGQITSNEAMKIAQSLK